MHAVEIQAHALDASGRAPAQLAERNNRLELLVGELLKANQELRFKVALLERPAAEAGHGPHPQSM
jgi:hypothetical protein